jgi:hypothetical protein
MRLSSEPVEKLYKIAVSVRFLRYNKATYVREGRFNECEIPSLQSRNRLLHSN